MKSSVFRDITPCSPQKMTPGFERKCHLHLHGRKINLAINQHEAGNKLCFMSVSFLAYYSTLTMEVICSSETSVDFQRTTWSYIQEYSILHSLPCAQGTSTSLLSARWIQSTFTHDISLRSISVVLKLFKPANPLQHNAHSRTPHPSTLKLSACYTKTDSNKMF
jgi:hypothetical protein